MNDLSEVLLGIHSFNKCLLSTYYASDTVLGLDPSCTVQDTLLIHDPYPRGTSILARESDKHYKLNIEEVIYK